VDKVRFKRREKEESVDLGVRLLKLLILRLYYMLSTNPLKWYEIIISTIMGVLCGLGIGVLVSGYFKVYLLIKQLG
jgi:membrane-associated HD superfamily phosphohydrolase